MKCKKCQNELSLEAKFCPNCGEKVEKTEIADLCYTYFAWGLLINSLDKKNKEFRIFMQKIKERIPELYEIYENPFAHVDLEGDNKLKSKSKNAK
jgi:hypothetical protein